MISVTVKNISISNVGFVVFLAADNDAERVLPIFIGVAEAQAIALQLNGITPPRPMTHDLMVSLVDLFDAELDHVLIHGLQDGTFFAKLVVKCEGVIKEIDARPSDAIALALRTGTSIFVDESVMEEAAVEVTDETGEHAEGQESPHPHAAEDPLTKMKAQLEEAIREERYEDAAKLRDEIKKQENRN
jgi:bifunctional DNase/RNase